MTKLISLLGTLPLLAVPVLAQDGVVDLFNLANYANQPVPPYIVRDNMPAGNPVTDLGATLGRVLFYDKRLSRNDTISCSSCHQQERGFSDLATASSGVSGTTGRHSMRLINARFSQEVRFFWDERATSVEDQATQPIQDHVEMGFSGTLGDPDFSDLITKLEAIPEYQVLFTGVFGDPAITEDRVQRSIAQFVRSIQSFDSKYDTGRAVVGADGPPFPNFTAAENRGKALFLAPPGPGGGAGCAGCHRPPEFDIDPGSGNNGVVGVIGGGTDFTVTRSPSLRDLVGPGGTSNGAFMHNASLPSLASVVAHYNNIPAIVPGLDPRLTMPAGPPGPPGDLPQSLGLTAGQQADLVAFLTTLTGTNLYTDPKWSSPFAADDSLSLIVLPSDCLEIETTATTLNCRGVGVPNVDYALEWSPTPAFTSGGSIALTADADGVVELDTALPPGMGRLFFRLVYEP